VLWLSGDKSKEAKLHDHFSNFRAIGGTEWFCLTPEHIDFIANNYSDEEEFEVQTPAERLGPSAIGVALKRIRENALMTQLQLSSKCGVERSNISKLESGLAQTADLSTLGRLASALGCNLTDLLAPAACTATPCVNQRCQ
jgi:DNA-binding Xre family transcriptional regulator